MKKTLLVLPLILIGLTAGMLRAEGGSCCPAEKKECPAGEKAPAPTTEEKKS